MWTFWLNPTPEWKTAHIFNIELIVLYFDCATEVKMGVIKYYFLDFDSLSDRIISMGDWYCFELYSQLASRLLLIFVFVLSTNPVFLL